MGGPFTEDRLRRVLVKRTCFTRLRGSSQDVPAGRGRWLRRSHSYNSYGRMAEAGTFHCANPAHSTLGVWELWRFLSWWIDHVAKGAVFIIMASLPSDHADVFDARRGATQQLDANRLGVSISPSYPRPDQTGVRAAPARRFQRQKTHHICTNRVHRIFEEIPAEKMSKRAIFPVIWPNEASNWGAMRLSQHRSSIQVRAKSQSEREVVKRFEPRIFALGATRLTFRLVCGFGNAEYLSAPSRSQFDLHAN